MNIKRYIAKDMMEATRRIREELGSDAVILHNKPIRKKGLRRLFSPPMVEVVVAYEPQRREPVVVRLPDEARRAPEKPAQQAESGREQKIRELNGKISDMQAMIKRPPEAPATPAPAIAPARPVAALQAEPGDADVDALAGKLSGMDLIEDMALSVSRKAKRAAKARGMGIDEAVRQVLADLLGKPEPIRVRRFERTVAILFGPTGVGKTTSLIKLAAHYTLEEKLRVGLINTDTYRLAAHEQLKAYADIIGTPLSAVYAPEEIVQALNEHEDKDIVFIDTAGKKPGDLQHQSDIEKLVRLSGASEVYLVIAAPTSSRACGEIIKNYNCLRDYKLLVTKTDETDSTATILNAKWLSGRPLSYVATGQNVPDDIQIADIDEILRRTFREESACLSRLAN